MPYRSRIAAGTTETKPLQDESIDGTQDQVMLLGQKAGILQYRLHVKTEPTKRMRAKLLVWVVNCFASCLLDCLMNQQIHHAITTHRCVSYVFE